MSGRMIDVGLARQALGFGDGKTGSPLGAGAPLTTYTRIRRAYKAICMQCMGSGYLATKHGPVKCPECKGTGEIERYFNKIVSAEEDE